MYKRCFSFKGKHTIVNGKLGKENQHKISIDTNRQETVDTYLQRSFLGKSTHMELENSHKTNWAHISLKTIQVTQLCLTLEKHHCK